MKITSKTGYYALVIVMGVISLVLAFLILNFHNKYPNKITIQHTLLTYLNKLNSQNNFINGTLFANLTIPFKVEFTNTNSKQFDLNYNEESNTLSLSNYDSLSTAQKEDLNNILYKYSLPKNLTSHLNLTKVDVPTKYPIYRQINLYIMVHEGEILKDYRHDIMQLQMFYGMKLQKTGLKLFIKFIYYDELNGVIDNADLYSDVKSLNPKILFEELNDKDNMNLILYNTSDAKHMLNYNEDLKSIIMTIDFTKDLKPSLLYKALSIVQLKTILPLKELNESSILSSKLLSQLLKMYNSSYYRYHCILMSSLSNLSKVNRIFPLYETIKTIDAVTAKINRISNILNRVSSNKFGLNDMEIVSEMYLDSIYLLESNELVVYEHFFSFEFKIGQFLPIMLPVVYGLTKAFKGIRATKSK